MHALVASPYKSAYNAAKHGVAGFTKTLALEVRAPCAKTRLACLGVVLHRTEHIAWGPLYLLGSMTCWCPARDVVHATDITGHPLSVSGSIRPGTLYICFMHRCCNRALPSLVMPYYRGRRLGQHLSAYVARLGLD